MRAQHFSLRTRALAKLKLALKTPCLYGPGYPETTLPTEATLPSVYMHGNKLSRLPGLPYMSRRDKLPSRVASSPETTRRGSYKRLVESFKDFTEKLARLG